MTTFKNRSEAKQADYRPVGNICKQCRREDDHRAEMRLDSFIIALIIIAVTLFLWWKQ